MADQETMLAQNLRDYIGIIRDAVGVEEKQLHLMNLVCAFLGMSATDFQVETYSGQQFVLLANLVLEVKANLHWHQSNEELKTRQYIADLNSRKPQANYVAIVTDGLHFHTFIPRYDESGGCRVGESVRPKPGQSFVDTRKCPARPENDPVLI